MNRTALITIDVDIKAEINFAGVVADVLARHVAALRARADDVAGKTISQKYLVVDHEGHGHVATFQARY